MSKKSAAAAASTFAAFFCVEKRVDAAVAIGLNPSGLPLLKIVPPIVAVAGGADSVYSPEFTAVDGSATFSPGSSTSTAITVQSIGNSVYIPGFAHVNAAGGATEGYFVTSGFVPTDTEVFVFRLLVNGIRPTPSQIAQIVSDENQYAAPPAPASTVSQSVENFLGGSYDLMVTASPAYFTPGESNFVGFDFATETNVGGVTVTDVAALSAVPEPANLAVVAATCLSMGRRRRQYSGFGIVRRRTSRCRANTGA